MVTATLELYHKRACKTLVGAWRNDLGGEAVITFDLKSRICNECGSAVPAPMVTEGIPVGDWVYFWKGELCYMGDAEFQQTFAKGWC